MDDKDQSMKENPLVSDSSNTSMKDEIVTDVIALPNESEHIVKVVSVAQINMLTKGIDLIRIPANSQVNN